jgi:cell division protein FtsI/penicillin-binding protein 2
MRGTDMGKKAVCLFFMFSLVMGVTALRLISINQSEYAQAAQSNNSISLKVSTSRGEIYDCNMKKLVNTKLTYYAAAKPSALAISALKPFLNESKLSKITERMSSGYPVCVEIPVSEINCGDITVLSVYSRYAENQIAAHAIGYLDGELSGATGIEKSFNNILSSDGKDCTVSFPVDARGRVLSGGTVTVKNNLSNSKRGVVTTIDRDIQALTEMAMAENKLECGAVVVLDIKTGEIKALASAPTYDPNNIASYLNDKNSPFINRALTAYSVGSVFKCVVAAAAIEQGGLENFEYVCTGKTEINGKVFHCHEDKGHGKINLSYAMAHSCNTYFINLAQRIQKERIIDIADKMGFGEETQLAADIVSAAGNLPDISELDSPAAVANLSFGQGSLLATPLQIAKMTACIANGGRIIEPSLIKSIIDDKGNIIQEKSDAVPEVVLPQSTADKVKKLLIYTVENGSGSFGRPDKTTAGAKTATAQSGIYKDGKELYNTWFTGFFPAENPQYVVTVLKENGESGSIDCGPVFKQIADGITDLNSSVE